MSLKFGLNVKKKAPIAPPRRDIWDEPEDDGDDDLQQDAAPPKSNARNATAPPKKFGLIVPSKHSQGRSQNALEQAKAEETQHESSLTSTPDAQIKAAEALDRSIFDYDSFHDAKSTMDDARKAAARQDAIERKPKYIDKLLNAAARRKLDQQAAKETMLKREREAEGDEFADKETFVTGAYKQQQEETKRLQEEEEKRLAADEERRRRLGSGMQGLYRSMMDQTDARHREAMALTAQLERGEAVVKKPGEELSKTETELAAEMRAKGVNVHVNEDGQVVDKRELLTSGLNVAPSGKDKNGSGSDHLKASAQARRSTFSKRDFASEQAQRERQSRALHEQMEASSKRKREEEDEQRAKEEREAKSKKTQQDVSDAKARYLARKAAKERGEG